MSVSAPADAAPASETGGTGPSPYLEPVAVGVRVAGVVVALAYLTGAIPGPLLAVAGGLALVTYGRGLLLERTPALVAGAAFAVIVAALAAGALRWSTLELAELRGAQAVVGPTLLIEKADNAYPLLGPIAAWTAAIAAILAMAVWLRFPRGEVWFSLLPWGGEMIVAALALATVFWGPAATALGSGEAGEIAAQLGIWALVTLIAAGAAGGLSFLLTRLARLWTLVVLAVAATAALVAVSISAVLVVA